MSKPKLNKQDYDRIARVLFLLLNRAMMYQANHPHIKDAIGNFQQELTTVLPGSSSLVLILNRDQLFLDEEPVDQRINTNRIVALFKKTGVQSISFAAGITVDELQTLITILTTPQKFSSSEKMVEELNFCGVQHLKINHVFYKKMTKDEKVISLQDQKEAAASVPGEKSAEVPDQLMKMLVEGLLAEDTEKALSMKNLLADPAGLSQEMLNAENKSMQAATSGNFPAGSTADDTPPAAGEDIKNLAPGATLLYQIQALSDDVNQKLEAGDQVDMMDVADAVSEMKRQLNRGIEAQKAVNQAFANEEQILSQMDELTDNVIIQLIKNEYQQGKISPTRLAHILRRLVPDAGGLKRLLPKIKIALIAEGMPMADYLQLVRQLGKELESDELSQILSEAAEAVGMEGEDLIEEIRKKPEQAAELMAIAAEIRKGTGDEKAFTEMLIDYVEQLGNKVREESADAGDGEEGAKARQMMIDVGSGLVAQLKNMDFSNEALLNMEERINARIGSVLEKFSTDSDIMSTVSAEPAQKEKTLLEMMERSVEGDEELKNFLRVIRAKADKKEIDENSFKQIYSDLQEQEKVFREQEEKRELPPGVLKTRDFRFYLEKELLRAKRHNHHLSVLPFSIIKVRFQDANKEKDRQIEKADVYDAAYRKLVETSRVSDIIGELSQGMITMILPMTDETNARMALRRISKLLNDHVFEINGMKLKMICAGSVASFSPDRKPNIESFIKTIGFELEHVVSRIKYVHRLA